MTGLREPETEYVREALEILPWTEDHQEHLEALLRIEDHALDPPSGHAGIMSRQILRKDHPYLSYAIHRELAPDRYREMVEKARRRASRSLERLDHERARLAKARRTWQELGGRVP